jgi:hypothetical protein
MRSMCSTTSKDEGDSLRDKAEPAKKGMLFQRVVGWRGHNPHAGRAPEEFFDERKEEEAEFLDMASVYDDPRDLKNLTMLTDSPTMVCERAEAEAAARWVISAVTLCCRRRCGRWTCRSS